MTGIADAITGGGSRSAADAQTQAAGLSMEAMKAALVQSLDFQERALDVSQSQFETALQLGEPYRNAGQKALAHYESMLYGVPIQDTSAYQSVLSTNRQAVEAAKPAEVPEGAWQTRPGFWDDETYHYMKKGDKMFRVRQESDDTWSEYKPETGAKVAPIPTEGYGDVSKPYDWKTSPGYQFRLEEGQKAVERGAAARSGLLSGRTGKALERYGQDVATLEYDKILNRLGGVVDVGARAAGAGAGQAIQTGQTQAGVLGQSAGLAFQTGQGLAGAESQVGAARASGYLGTQAAGTNILNMGSALVGTMMGGEAGQAWGEPTPYDPMAGSGGASSSSYPRSGETVTWF